MMHATYRRILFSSVSALALTTSAAPALAIPFHVTFDTTSDSITHAGSGHTTVSGNTATTDSGGDTHGGEISGSGTGIYDWNINGNITGLSTSGFTNLITAGTANINVHALVRGDNHFMAFTYDGFILNTSGSAVTNILNTGTITTGSSGNGINVTGSSAVGTIDNYGTISSGSGATGILIGSSATVGTINNYAGGVITGDTVAIDQNNAANGVTINNAGTINGDVHLRSNTGNGDTVNIYGGAINGTLYGINGEGFVSTVNFDLVGGTFGIDGTSVDGTFTTNGNIGDSSGHFNDVNINSGTVILNNEIHTNTATIASGATLRVNAESLGISGTLVNNGTLNVQTHLFDMSGFTGSGTLALQVQPGAGGTHGYVFADSSELNNMTISPSFARGAVTPGETLVIVDNDNSLIADTARIVSSNGIKWTLSEAAGAGTDYQNIAYGAGSLLATASLLTSGVPALNAASLNALSSYSGSDPDILALKNGLTSAADDNQAGAQLRPQTNGGGVLGVLGATGQAQDIISTHLDNYNGSSGMPSGEIPPGLGFWAQGFGSFASQGTVSGIDGFSSSSYGGTFGGDKDIRDDLRLGVALTYADTDVNDKGTRNGSGEKIDSYIANFYSTYRADAWYIDGLLTYGDHDYATTRMTNFSGASTIAQGSFNGQQLGAKAEIGYPVAMDRFTVTPLAALAYDHLHQQGYEESGAGGADLVVAGSTVDSYRGTLGAKFATVYTLGNGWRLKPIAHLAWRHEFNDNLVPDEDVNFAGGGVAFVAPGVKLAQDAADYGIDMDLMTSNHLTLNARYEGEYRSGYIDNAFLFKARFDF